MKSKTAKNKEILSREQAAFFLDSLMLYVGNLPDEQKRDMVKRLSATARQRHKEMTRTKEGRMRILKWWS